VNGVHDDECLSDSCTLYVSMNGKFDVIAAPASSAGAK